MSNIDKMQKLSATIDSRLSAAHTKGLARKDTLRRAAIMGLSNQLYRLNKSNAVNFEELQTDIKRALNYLRNEA